MSRVDCTRPCEHNTLASLLMLNHGFISANYDQDLLEVQKEQARDNIDAVSEPDVVSIITLMIDAMSGTDYTEIFDNELNSLEGA